MKVTPKFSKKDLIAMIDRVTESEVKAYLNKFEKIGLDALVAQKTNISGKDYTDRTRNLRGSIGYVIKRNGKELTAGGFEPNKEGKDEGADEGKALARRVKPVRGLQLVMVAGMKYAKAVSRKGYDVLDTAYLHVEREAEKMKRKK